MNGIIYVIVYLTILFPLNECCTDLLITKGANAENSNIITYNADSDSMYGYLKFSPSESHPPDSKRKIYDWGTGKYLGSIPQIPHTFRVMGNMNEKGLAIGESTCGVTDWNYKVYPGSILDYGSLIYIALERSSSAKEAVDVMTTLANTYGYVSNCESISIADEEEIWYMELKGKGEFELGIVWVALKVPDGYISAHANHARIRTFDRSDTENVMCSEDVISFAREHGLIPPDLPDGDFSFTDAYDTVNFFKARYSESRVWSLFNHVNSHMGIYLDYAQGYNLTNPLPVWIKPDHPITLSEVFTYMRDHFEGTWFDNSLEVGAQAFKFPLRWGFPLYHFESQEYVPNRNIGVQKTAFYIAAQLQGNMVPEIGSILWFGVDDTSFSIHLPVYAGLQSVPYGWSKDNGNILQFSYTSAFWIFNLVANFAYIRYDLLYPVILDKINTIETQLIGDVEDITREANQIYLRDPTQAIQYVSEYTLTTADWIVSEWWKFYGEIFPQYVDGYKKTKVDGQMNPTVQTPGYSSAWYARIVQATGDHYLLRAAGNYDNYIDRVSEEDIYRFERLARKGKI